MKSQTTSSFWKHYWALPPEIRRRAQQAFKLWRANPAHPSLFFKRVKENQPVYSVRIGLGYRALGLLQGNTSRGFGSAIMTRMNASSYERRRVGSRWRCFHFSKFSLSALDSARAAASILPKSNVRPLVLLSFSASPACPKGQRDYCCLNCPLRPGRNRSLGFSGGWPIEWAMETS